MKKILLTPFLVSLFLLFSTIGIPAQPDLNGEWAAPQKTPDLLIHSSVLPNGKVLYWPSNYSKEPRQDSMTYLWAPESGLHTQIFNSTTNLFCAGHSFLPDGKLLATGGHYGFINDDYVGEKHINIFDYRTNAWSRGPDMRERRWYPTNLTLPNGEVLIVGGQINSATNINQIHEVYQTDGTLRELTTAQRSLPLYPWLINAPNGQVFVAGPSATTSFLDPSGTGTATPGPTSSYGFRDYGSFVVYDEGKIMIAGGGSPTNTAEVIDLNQPNPSWRYTGPMTFSRRQSNLTLLPDGSVLVTGGTSSTGFNNGAGSVLTAELWDPQSETWRNVSSYQERRLYHSTAFLLPDGRVAIAGGGQPIARDISDYDHKSIEIFSPPYLFKGKRPKITSIPATASYGDRIEIKTPRHDLVSRVVLMGLGSVTHSMDQGQKIIRMPITRRKWETVTAQVSTNRNSLPPGPYMLFLLNGLGVPSEAKMIFIGERPSPTAKRKLQ